MDKKSLKDVKRNNTAKVLEYILKQGPVSRIEIAEQSGFSPSTVSMACLLYTSTGHADDGDQDTRHKYRIAYVYAKQDGGRICCHNSCENNQIHDFLKNCFCFHNKHLSIPASIGGVC